MTWQQEAQHAQQLTMQRALPPAINPGLRQFTPSPAPAIPYMPGAQVGPQTLGLPGQTPPQSMAGGQAPMNFQALLQMLQQRWHGQPINAPPTLGPMGGPPNIDPGFMNRPQPNIDPGFVNQAPAPNFGLPGGPMFNRGGGR